MRPAATHGASGAQAEVTTLIEQFRESEFGLEQPKSGGSDTVTGRDARSILLRGGQDHLRPGDATRQAAILDALPAHVALLDARGVIVSANKAWRLFAQANALPDPAGGIGENYLQICDRARGDGSADALRVAEGLRAVLGRTEERFSIEYPCHSPTQQRWYELTATPLADDRLNGAVVMHVDVTARKLSADALRASEAEQRKLALRVEHMNRVHAMLSGINTLIVRVRNTDELYRKACQIAVDAGGFRMSLVCIVDRDAATVAPVAYAGKDDGLIGAIKARLSSAAGAANTMVARAIREKQAVVSNDSGADPQVVFGPQYAAAGVRSMVVLPLVVADEAVGVLALYASESDYFQDEELKLLKELADDVAFAIDHLGKQARLDYLAYYDELTGLANRNLAHGRVAQYMRSAESRGHKLALCLLDLERFKYVNHALGRAAGDSVLRHVAQLLTRNVGDAIQVARVDGDQFAVVLPEVDRDEDVARHLEQLMRDFRANPFHLGDSTFTVVAKAGIALFPGDGLDAETLFTHAEAALRKAKAGGDRYLFYTQKMTEAVAGKLTLENQLRQALERKEFVLHYQPKVSLVSGRVTGAEALIRWNDPRTGLVPPGRFIPVLEETGLIREVGRWALRKAVDDYRRWIAAGLPAVPIAVNVSPLQLRHNGFVAEIAQVLSGAPGLAAGLELEITESVIMEDVARSIATLGAIRAMGVRVAIDDFGTGFSSLAYLAKLPIDTLKIDRSFVTEISTTPEGLALVSTIITLAHSLKLNAVAEGVETKDQSRLLRLLSCDEMQGFLYSKAVPIDIFEARFLGATAAATATADSASGSH